MRSHENKYKFILLSTEIAYLSYKSETEFKVKCLLDTGTVSFFISRNCVEMMKLKKENNNNIVISGLNDASLEIKYGVKYANKQSRQEV